MGSFMSKHCNSGINYGTPLEKKSCGSPNKQISPDLARKMAETTKKWIEDNPTKASTAGKFQKMKDRADEIYSSIGGYKGMKEMQVKIENGTATPEEIKAFREARRKK